jgi:hypothetical protein
MTVKNVNQGGPGSTATTSDPQTRRGGVTLLPYLMDAVWMQWMRKSARPPMSILPSPNAPRPGVQAVRLQHWHWAMASVPRFQAPAGIRTIGVGFYGLDDQLPIASRTSSRSRKRLLSGSPAPLSIFGIRPHRRRAHRVAVFATGTAFRRYKRNTADHLVKPRISCPPTTSYPTSPNVNIPRRKPRVIIPRETNSSTTQ